MLLLAVPPARKTPDLRHSKSDAMSAAGVRPPGEDVFAAPHEFDIGRDPNPHVSFGGGGPHFCLGRHLASLELRILLQAIAGRMPGIILDGEVSRLRSNFINGIKHMPVRFSARTN